MLFRSTTRIIGTMLAAALVGCDSEPKGLDQAGPETFLSVAPVDATVDPGGTQQLVATKDGEDATGVTWTSNNTAAATVSGTGLVSAVASGFAAITATLPSGESRSAGITVPVLQGTQIAFATPVTGLAGSAARNTITLYRVFVPAGTTNLTVTLSGGTGDVDLLVRRQTPPTATSTGHCRSELAANAESCVIANPAAGTWYIGLLLWDPYTGVTLTATKTP
jgi:serine protease